MASLPASVETAFAAALTRYQDGAPAEAAELFAAVLDEVPDHADALRLRGLSLVRAGQADAALPLLARARRLAPEDPLAHLHYGIGLLEAGRPARGAALFRRAASMAPDDPVPWINLSAAILALGEPRAARAAARRALALAPRSAEAHYALGLAERAARNVAGARAAFAAATELSPGFADAWVNLGVALFQLGQVEAGGRAMRQALAIRPGYSAAEANLAGFMLLQGHHDEALARLRAVIERDPACVPARLNLVNALLLDREATEALALLEGSTPPGREGAHWRAHRATALMLQRRPADAATELELIPKPYGDAEILIVWRQIALAERARDTATALKLAGRLEALADEEGVSLLEHRIVSHFDLAAFRNRRGETAAAFNHWQAGHRLLGRVQPFSRETFRQFVDSSIAAFDDARLRDGARARNDDDTAIFIIGTPRSGTSLTEQILAAHPAVHGGGELPNLSRTITSLAGPPLQPATVNRLAVLDEATLTAAAAQYIAELRDLAPEARFITDKMPGNAQHLGFLTTLLPGARVILCRRDPRDIGLSIFQLRFFGYHPYAHDLGDLGWYLAEHERLIAHWRAALPQPPIEIELADWVSDFAGTLARVLAALGLPHDPACERFYEQPRRVRTASAEQVRQPINARGLGRWRRYAAHLTPMLYELQRAGLLPAEPKDPGAVAAVADDAEATLRQQLAQDPANAQLHCRLGELLLGSFRPVAAEREFALADHAAPGDPAIVKTRALAALRAGRQQEAREIAARALELAPADPRVHQVYCNVLAYCDGVSGSELTAALQRGGALWPRSPPMGFSNLPDPARPLRVGLILADVSQHPVAWLSFAGLEGLEASQFAIHCFVPDGREDDFTARLRRVATGWHPIARLDDRMAAERIRAQRIDVLIDLSGYLVGGRMPVLAHRPAPVQIKWVGGQYHTSGIEEVDWFITDRWETPPELAALYGERLLTLPGSYVCYTPPTDAPEVGGLPALARGAPTFGSFNSLMKVTPRVIETWAALLARVPGARLLVAAIELHEAETVVRIRQAFASLGIAEERVELAGIMEHRALLALYNQVDLALQPFPYSGGLTVLEALWMGVPSIALAGESFAARHAFSHLSQAGLADFVAESPDAYIARAVAKAADLPGLARLRSSLRERLRRSPVCNRASFATALGTAIRGAWREWCAAAV